MFVKALITQSRIQLYLYAEFIQKLLAKSKFTVPLPIQLFEEKKLFVSTLKNIVFFFLKQSEILQGVVTFSALAPNSPNFDTA